MTTNKLSHSPRANASTEQPNDLPTEKPNPKPMLNMPTTQKVLQQVECQACKRKMSAKTLNYNHAQYCTAREKEEHPEEIPGPKLEIKNGGHLKNTASLPVKKGKLKRSKPITKEVFEGEAKAPASTPALPPQIEQSFHFQMRERLQQKEAKYQVMMSNAFETKINRGKSRSEGAPLPTQLIGHRGRNPMNN